MKLTHEPMMPARKGHDGEQVYSSMWRAMMVEVWEEDSFDGEDSTPIETILGYMPVKLTQRHATVAATVICWLGCNMGNALMHRARREIAAGRWDADVAYLLAWTLDNKRTPYVNSGVRSIEYMLALPEDRNDRTSFLDSGLTKLPDLSAADLEVVEHVMRWLPSKRGQQFIRLCEREIERLRDEERRRKAAEFDRLRGGAEA